MILYNKHMKDSRLNVEEELRHEKTLDFISDGNK